MANAIYPKYKEALLNADANVDLVAGAVKAILVDLADYSYSAAHQFLGDVPALARVAISGNMATPSVADGTFDCLDYAWTAVTGDQAEAIVYYIDTGVAGTSRLVAYIDTGQTGLPVTPNGGDITYNVAPAGVFTL